MFTRRNEAQLQSSLDAAHASLQSLDPTSKDYEVVLDRISKLQKMAESNRPKSVSPDTLVMAATNLLGIVLILNYERLGIVTSKALPFVSKTR